MLHGKQKNTFFDYFNILLMLFFVVLVLVPFWHIFVISLSTYKAYISSTYHLLPTEVTLDNYMRALSKGGEVLRSLGVSGLVTGIGLLISMPLTTMAGYAMSKNDMPGRTPIFIFFIITMFFSGGTIPFYIIMTKLGLRNNLWSMILPMALSTYNIILMKNFFLGIPESLEEAARIDGYNDIQILFKIVLPISTPVMAAVALFYAVDYWNSYFNAYLLVSSASLWPFQMCLRQLTIVNVTAARAGVNSGPMIYESYKMAIVFVGIVPVLLVYPFVQKYFSTGVMLGAVKE